MNKAFETAYNFLKDGVACKLSRDGGVWTCERIERARELMQLDYQVTYYRDMHNGHRVWIVEWKK